MAPHSPFAQGRFGLRVRVRLADGGRLLGLPRARRVALRVGDDKNPSVLLRLAMRAGANTHVGSDCRPGQLHLLYQGDAWIVPKNHRSLHLLGWCS
jgi:hypothetical protein